MLRACATLFLLSSISGCALSHDREWMSHPVVPPDASLLRPDVGPIAVTDASLLPRDAAPIPADAGSCTLFWRSLPSCPTSNAVAAGAPCTDEGATCGVRCCEPGPPIACLDGHWTLTSPEENCGPDCAPWSPCGDGFCAADRICLRTDEPITTGLGTCVAPPAPISSCSAAPAGSLTSDMHTCLSCRCTDQPTGPVINLSCDCCDL